MNRLGFVNFWYYDREEFQLTDGHFLLRGQNGAGKSITTSSFVPLILDGDRRPERLDPWGSRARKFDFYLLGDGEKEESTAYIYLEFRKPDAEMYLTLCIGLRAQRGKSTDFWGFCLRDGRRIGHGGFDLVETVGDQQIPLSKQKMRNLLNSPDDWTDSQGKYRQMVNERLFGFHDIRQYEQLVNLLIKVRAPKLEKESQRPQEVKRILNDSLSVLTDEDLSAMISTMEQMDQLEDQLRDLRESMREADIVQREYNRYNRYMLGHKSRAWLDGCDAAGKSEAALKQAQEQLEQTRKNLEEQTRTAQDAELKEKQAVSQRAELGEDDLSAKQEQLQQMERNCADLSSQISRSEANLSGIGEDIRRKEVQLRQRKAESENARLEIDRERKNLDSENRILQLGDEHDDYVLDLHDEWEADSSRVRNALDRREGVIRQMLECLKELETAAREYDEACEATGRAEKAQRDAETRHRDAQLLEQSERDQLMEKFIRRQDSARELLLSEEDAAKIKRSIAMYSSTADWVPIRDILDNEYQRRTSTLNRLHIQAEAEHETRRRQAEALHKELEDVLSHPDPAPPRRAGTEEIRRVLRERGIPHVPLYEAVDFRPDLSQKERNLLEAQLTDTGLLDALLVPEAYRQAVTGLMAAYPDRILVPGAPAADPLTGLVPDSSRGDAELAAACLAGISQSDLNAETAVLPDGTWRIGALKGSSRGDAQAEYVGAAARKAARERRIQNLKDLIAAEEAELSRLADVLAELDRRLEVLREERAAMPSDEGLGQAVTLLQQMLKELHEAEMETDRCRNRERQAKQQERRLEQRRDDIGTGIPYPRTRDSYEEAKETLDEYRRILQTLERAVLELKYRKQSELDMEEHIEDLREQQSRQKETVDSQRSQLSVEESRAQAVRDLLNSEENRTRAQMLRTLAQEIQNQRERRENARMEMSRLEERIKSCQSDLDRCCADAEAERKKEGILRSYLREEMDLDLPAPDRTLPLERFAREAWNQVAPGDRDRTPEQMTEALLNNIQQYSQSLVRYHIRSDITFDPPAEAGQLRQRRLVTLQKDSGTMSIYSFIRMLQGDIDLNEAVLEDKDRELFENILSETVSFKLRSRIEETQQWTKDMSRLMENFDSSMGLTFRLDWRPKKAESEEEMDTVRLVELLNKDRALLREEDSQQVASHFRTRVRAARESALQEDRTPSYGDLIRETLDYRTWYEFRLYVRFGSEDWKELTNARFDSLSGGERGLSTYLPLYAALNAQYDKAGPEAPRILALDEAFAGVDDKNISSMFELTHTLKFDYIMNSQAVWGCYEQVPDLDIADLYRPLNSKVVTILHYHWDGVEKKLLDEVEEDAEEEEEEEDE